jgi:hypothetical protein
MSAIVDRSERHANFDPFDGDEIAIREMIASGEYLEMQEELRLDCAAAEYAEVDEMERRGGGDWQLASVEAR